MIQKHNCTIKMFNRFLREVSACPHCNREISEDFRFSAKNKKLTYVIYDCNCSKMHLFCNKFMFEIKLQLNMHNTVSYIFNKDVPFKLISFNIKTRSYSYKQKGAKITMQEFIENYFK